MKFVRVFDMITNKQIYSRQTDELEPYEAEEFIKAKVAKRINKGNSIYFDIQLTVPDIYEAIKKVKEYRKRTLPRKDKTTSRCWNCGVPVRNVNTKARCYCEPCRKKKEQEDAERAHLLDKLRYEQLIERAIVLLEKQEKPINVLDYRIAYENICNYDNGVKVFDSAHEVLVYMELLKCKVEADPNFNIKRYRADFCLPELKIILEIDGHLHKNKTVYDENRDREIRAELGEEWEVVRIPTEYVEKNIKQLIPAAKAIRNEMQKYRVLNNGDLPEYFSQRQRDKRRKKS